MYQSALKFAIVLFSALYASIVVAEKPVKHLDLPDLTSLEVATNVFSDTTQQLKTKTKLDAGELHDIHIITYSLEKAVAYFADNLEGGEQKIANKMVDAVERVHLSSENNHSSETATYLEEYFQLSEELSSSLLNNQ